MSEEIVQATKRVLDTEDADATSKRAKMVDEPQGPATSEVQTLPATTGSNASKKPEQAASTSTDASNKGKGKQPKKKKSPWGRRGTRADDAEQANSDQPKEPRLPKRQCALLMGFCGSRYRGMQFQPDLNTVENTLFDALVRASAISKDNADDPVKVHLGRAARTDKGVHAAGNVVSLKMITSVPGQGSMLERINAELPDDIRLWDFVRVQNSFSARTACDSRKYTYFFPSYLLIPPKPGSGLDRALKRHDPSRESDPVDEFWASQTTETTADEDLERKRRWRCSSARLETSRTTAEKFLGTHNFHNFTVTRSPKAATNYRHIKTIEVEDPTVYGDTEWIAVLIHGQSFMLHQIRKMVFALVMACRTGTPDIIFHKLYSDQTVVSIPKMPALGLLLEAPIFESYNAKVAAVNAKVKPGDPEYRPPIDFDAQAEKMAAFKQKYIYDNMRSIEDRKGLFDAWLRSVDMYSGDDLLYLNKEGTIPEASIVIKGQQRKNPFKESRKFDLTSFTEDDKVKMTAEVGDADVEEAEGMDEEDMTG